MAFLIKDVTDIWTFVSLKDTEGWSWSLEQTFRQGNHCMTSTVSVRTILDNCGKEPFGKLNLAGGQQCAVGKLAVPVLWARLNKA